MSHPDVQEQYEKAEAFMHIWLRLWHAMQIAKAQRFILFDVCLPGKSCRRV